MVHKGYGKKKFSSYIKFLSKLFKEDEQNKKEMEREEEAIDRSQLKYQLQKNQQFSNVSTKDEMLTLFGRADDLECLDDNSNFDFDMSLFNTS